MNEILQKIEEQIPLYNADDFTELDGEWKRLVNYDNYYRWLWAAVKVLQPKHIVEIGRERGVSAIIMLHAMPDDGILTSIDINADAIFLENNQDDRLEMLTMDSLDAAHLLEDDIDFLFIDGDHTKEQVEQEWALYSPKVVKGGIIVFDDIHFNDGMTDFWNSIEGEKYDISRWHEMGFGVLFT